MKDFFLKIWAENMSTHYAWQNMVMQATYIIKNFY